MHLPVSELSPSPRNPISREFSYLMLMINQASKGGAPLPSGRSIIMDGYPFEITEEVGKRRIHQITFGGTAFVATIDFHNSKAGLGDKWAKNKNGAARMGLIDIEHERGPGALSCVLTPWQDGTVGSYVEVDKESLDEKGLAAAQLCLNAFGIAIERFDNNTYFESFDDLEPDQIERLSHTIESLTYTP